MLSIHDTPIMGEEKKVGEKRLGRKKGTREQRGRKMSGISFSK